MTFDPTIDTVDSHPLVVRHDELIRDLNAKLEATLAALPAAEAMLASAELAQASETPAERAARLIAGKEGPGVAKEQQTADRLRARADEIRSTISDMRDARNAAVVRARNDLRAAAAPARAKLVDAAWKAAEALADALTAVDDADLSLMKRESPGCHIDEADHRRHGARLAHVLPSAAALREAIARRGAA